jgi:hypothetical protein
MQFQVRRSHPQIANVCENLVRGKTSYNWQYLQRPFNGRYCWVTSDLRGFDAGFDGNFELSKTNLEKRLNASIRIDVVNPLPTTTR